MVTILLAQGMVTGAVMALALAAMGQEIRIALVEVLELRSPEF